MALAATLARRRPYFGWYLVGALFVSNFVSSGLNTYALAVFLKPMTEELGWSRGFFSSVVYLATIISSPLSMLVWPLVDRRGARGLMLVSGVILGVGTAALGLVHTKWEFILIKSVIMPFGTVGVGGMVSMMVVTNWFIRKRGRMLAITAMGMSTAGIAMTPFATFLVSTLGWRHAWMVLGLAALLLNVVPAALFMRRRPEDLGLLPDGDSAALQSGPGRPPPPSEARWSRREAMGTSTFWLMAFTLPLGFLGMGVVNQHLYSYLTDIHFARRIAALVFMTVSVVSLAAKLPWGAAMERWPVRYCFCAAYSLMGLGMAVLVLAGGNLILLLAAAGLMGLGWSANIPLQGLIWADYFGRMSQGRIRSMATPMTVAAGPLGPVLAAFMWDITGSYRNIFAAYIGTAAVGAFLILFARPPKKQPSSPLS